MVDRYTEIILSLMSSIGTAQRWFPPEMRGFIGSLVLSGYGFGSLMWIPLETAFVNPGNG